MSTVSSKEWAEQANSIALVATALAEGTVTGPTYAAVLKLQGQVEMLLAWTVDDRLNTKPFEAPLSSHIT